MQCTKFSLGPDISKTVPNYYHFLLGAYVSVTSDTENKPAIKVSIGTPLALVIASYLQDKLWCVDSPATGLWIVPEDTENGKELIAYLKPSVVKSAVNDEETKKSLITGITESLLSIEGATRERKYLTTFISEDQNKVERNTIRVIRVPLDKLMSQIIFDVLGIKGDEDDSRSA